MEELKESGKIKEVIYESAKEVLAKMGFEGEVEVSETSKGDQKSLVCNIKTEDSNYLIGQYGVNLQALQHIVRVIVRKKTNELINFVMDVNLYRQEKDESVVSLAKNMAEKAVLEKRTVVLRPMSSYERRLVHMELSGNEQIETESLGEGEDRRVAIKPKGLV